MSCFFGIMMGMLSLGMAAPNIKSVVEGRVAGKIVFDIIDRSPQISIDSKDGKIMDTIEGNIEFKNVTFNYPSRPDTKVLNNFSAVF